MTTGGEGGNPWGVVAVVVAVVGQNTRTKKAELLDQTDQMDHPLQLFLTRHRERFSRICTVVIQIQPTKNMVLPL